jgi:PAS domain S-box-containing protein
MWRFLQHGSLDGVWYWDLEAPNNEWMGPEMWRLFGIAPETKSHDPAEWQDIIFAEDLAVALENFNKHCADPSHPYDQIVRYRHADGSTVWVRCRGIAIRDEAGKPVRMLGAHNDLTAVKRLEEQADIGSVAADAANEELRTFAYSIAHDMKAPANTLYSLLNRLSMMMPVDRQAPQRQLMNMSLQTIDRMRVLVDDVLQYTRVVGSETAFQAIDLNEIANSLVDILAGDIEATGATVTIDSLPVIDADAMQMRALLQNVISNAIKFNRDGVPPEIRVSSTKGKQRGGVVLSVQDNGAGIPEDMQDRVFAMFTRLHLHDEFAGAGLGLALCRRIAVNHGGGIKVVSTPDIGSIFSVDLPIKQPSAQARTRK